MTRLHRAPLRRHQQQRRRRGRATRVGLRRLGGAARGRRTRTRSRWRWRLHVAARRSTVSKAKVVCRQRRRLCNGRGRGGGGHGAAVRHLRLPHGPKHELREKRSQRCRLMPETWRRDTGIYRVTVVVLFRDLRPSLCSGGLCGERGGCLDGGRWRSCGSESLCRLLLSRRRPRCTRFRRFLVRGRGRECWLVLVVSPALICRHWRLRGLGGYGQGGLRVHVLLPCGVAFLVPFFSCHLRGRRGCWYFGPPYRGWRGVCLGRRSLQKRG